MHSAILYYIPDLSRKDGGIFQYSMKVLEELRDSKRNIVVYNSDDYNYLAGRFKDAQNITIVQSSTGYFHRIKNKLKRLSVSVNKELRFMPVFSEETIPTKVLKKYKIKIIHSPTQSFPRNNIPFIFTLHDVQELHLPEFFTPHEREQRARNNRLGCAKASRIVVSYNHVKQDLIKFFNLPPEIIDVVFIGSPDPELEVRENTLTSGKKYILYPAATWPHKNHLNLIKAFILARQNHPDFGEYKLVCTGHQTEHFKQIALLISESGIDEYIEFKGLVSDNELKDLYQNTTAVVVPTKYEAGSFPLMESLVQNIPVICSNVTSLPETIEDENFVFDPNDIPEMSDKIYRITCDPKYREANVKLSLQLRPKLIERKLAATFDEIYNKVK